MARKTKKATESVAVAVAENDISGISVLSENNNLEVTEVAEVANDSVKYISLNQLYIVKEYIDNKFKDLLNALVESENGIHGLRYQDNKLQHQNPDGTWSDIITNSSDSTGSTGGLTNENFATDEEVKNIFKNI